MSPRRREPLHGFQLDFFQDQDAAAVAWTVECGLRADARDYEDRLVGKFGLSRSTARLRVRHLLAMVREVGAGTIASFVTDGDQVVAMIQRVRASGTRQARHLAVMDYLELFADRLPVGAKAESEAAIAHGFPGRPAPRADLVDLSLGGERRQLRPDIPLTWMNGEAIIACAEELGGESRTASRDAAMLAVFLRSGLPAYAVRELRWEDIVPALVTDDEVSWVVVRGMSGGRRFAIHAVALRALRALRATVGNPEAGRVFCSVRGSRQPLSDQAVAYTVRRAVQAAGLPACDRRHLRRQFAWWLLTSERWDELLVRDALGYEEVRDLRRLLRPLVEASAQARSGEFLLLDPGPLRSAPLRPATWSTVRDHGPPANRAAFAKGRTHQPQGGGGGRRRGAGPLLS